jgi:hypothetical protein
MFLKMYVFVQREEEKRKYRRCVNIFDDKKNKLIFYQ